jgi:hypothetical protein
MSLSRLLNPQLRSHPSPPLHPRKPGQTRSPPSAISLQEATRSQQHRSLTRPRKPQLPRSIKKRTISALPILEASSRTLISTLTPWIPKTLLQLPRKAPKRAPAQNTEKETYRPTVSSKSRIRSRQGGTNNANAPTQKKPSRYRSLIGTNTHAHLSSETPTSTGLSRPVQRAQNKRPMYCTPLPLLAHSELTSATTSCRIIPNSRAKSGTILKKAGCTNLGSTNMSSIALTLSKAYRATTKPIFLPKSSRLVFASSSAGEQFRLRRTRSTSPPIHLPGFQLQLQGRPNGAQSTADTAPRQGPVPALPKPSIERANRHLPNQGSNGHLAIHACCCPRPKFTANRSISCPHTNDQVWSPPSLDGPATTWRPPGKPANRGGLRVCLRRNESLDQPRVRR